MDAPLSSPMPAQKWAEIALDATGDMQETAGTLLTETAGCHGYTATHKAVMGYLPVDDRLENTLLTLREAVQETSGLSNGVTIRFVAEEDWATAWKQYFKPQRVGKNLVVKPTWETWDAAPSDLVIQIDPGMAFGTGLHGTTRLCLLGLESAVFAGASVADVGTGSGILSVCAALLGAGRVEAVDNDPLAVRVARENVRVNGVTDLVRCEEASAPPSGEFDIVVANILADVILGMASDLFAAVKPGGLLIASGIIAPRAQDVARGLERAGFISPEITEEGEWIAINSRRPTQ